METRMISNSHPDVMQFFLDYHQKNVTEYHYFCYHDYRKFFTMELMDMAKLSNVLCIALVAFSALIYSMKQRSAREQAFWYYTLALRQLRELLNTAMDVSELSPGDNGSITISYIRRILSANMLRLTTAIDMGMQSNVFDIYRAQQIS